MIYAGQHPSPETSVLPHSMRTGVLPNASILKIVCSKAILHLTGACSRDEWSLSPVSLDISLPNSWCWCCWSESCPGVGRGLRKVCLDDIRHAVQAVQKASFWWAVICYPRRLAGSIGARGRSLQLLGDWMRQLDKKMTLKGRKILLIVDNCSVHPTIQMKSIELVFLPPNTISVTCGIIRNFKVHYRYILSNGRLAASDEGTAFTWNILDAVIVAKTAWNHVTLNTIQNCHRKVGFRREDTEEQPEVKDDKVWTSFRNIWGRLRDIYGNAVPKDLDDYIDADSVTETSVSLTDAEIVGHVKNPADDNNISDDKDNEDDRNDSANLVTVKDAYAAVRTLHMFGLKHGLDDIEDWTDKIETVVMK